MIVSTFETAARKQKGSRLRLSERRLGFSIASQKREPNRQLPVQSQAVALSPNKRGSKTATRTRWSKQRGNFSRGWNSVAPKSVEKRSIGRWLSFWPHIPHLEQATSCLKNPACHCMRYMERPKLPCYFATANLIISSKRSCHAFTSASRRSQSRPALPMA